LDFRLSQGASDNDTTVTDAVRQGFYARPLRAYLDHFPADQVLVLQYEACAADPAAHLRTTYDFLGLEAHHPEDLRRTVNVSSQKRQLDADTARRLVDVYRSDVEDLVRLVPSLDLSFWPHFAALAR
jgi:hypothetical protein